MSVIVVPDDQPDLYAAYVAAAGGDTILVRNGTRPLGAGIPGDGALLLGLQWAAHPSNTADVVVDAAGVANAFQVYDQWEFHGFANSMFRVANASGAGFVGRARGRDSVSMEWVGAANCGADGIACMRHSGTIQMFVVDACAGSGLFTSGDGNAVANGLVTGCAAYGVYTGGGADVVRHVIAGRCWMGFRVFGAGTNLCAFEPTVDGIIGGAGIYTYCNNWGAGRDNWPGGVPATCLELNPQFLDPTGRDYLYPPSSPLFAAGTLTGVVDSLNGVARKAFPDIGCYEILDPGRREQDDDGRFRVPAPWVRAVGGPIRVEVSA